MARRICSYAQKAMFPNKLECDLAIMDIQSRARKHRKQKFREEPKRSYQCESCHQWHMTSQEKRSDETVGS